MGPVRRFVGAVVLLLAGAGVVGCIAGVVGMWWLGRNVPEKVEAISARLDAALRRASAANQNVQRAVARARIDVAEVVKESGEGGKKGRRASRAVRTLIQQKVGPRIEDVRGRLDTWSDAAVAAVSLLQSFQELPSSRVRRIKPDQLEQWGGEARQLSANLRRLKAVVGDGGKEAGGREVLAATSDADLVLKRCQAKLGIWQSNLDAAREELQDVKATILDGLTLAGIAVPLLCVWMALGQVSLFAHALSWFRGRSSG
jgi:hypothetical protein